MIKEAPDNGMTQEEIPGYAQTVLFYMYIVSFRTAISIPD